MHLDNFQNDRPSPDSEWITHSQELPKMPVKQAEFAIIQGSTAAFHFSYSCFLSGDLLDDVLLWLVSFCPVSFSLLFPLSFEPLGLDRIVALLHQSLKTQKRTALGSHVVANQKRNARSHMSLCLLCQTQLHLLLQCIHGLTPTTDS